LVKAKKARIDCKMNFDAYALHSKQSMPDLTIELITDT
jgi:hypothetical protein